MTPKEVLGLIREQNVKVVDLRFMDFPGMWQHFTIPAQALEEDSFDEGIGFDGSSIRGWQEINESDMLVMPQPQTSFLDPFRSHKTLILLCNIQDPLTKQDYTRDPRNIARKAAQYMESSGVADTANFGPEAEFFILDDIRYDANEHEAYYHVDSIEGAWNTGTYEEPNLGHKLRYKEGYFPTPPSDSLMDMRTEMVLHMIEAGIDVEAHHHEVSTGGQAEIDMRFNPLVEMADALVIYKYIAKNVAKQHGKTVTFMPKPIYNDNGSGMHTHLSLWKGGEPLFAGNGYAGLSEMALHAAGGILHHAPAICAFAAPTTSSYKRLVPGFEAPVNLAMSQRNRSAAVRIPVYSPSPKAKRLEFRCPDPSCNPYLAFSAILMAALDGIDQKMDPGSPLDVNLYDLAPEQAAEVRQTPGSLEEALGALREDHEFLLKDDVFTQDVIETWIDYKMKNEVDALRLRPHPYEFVMYYDI